MLKKIMLLMVASTSLFAGAESDYDDGMKLLKEARSDCQKITDWKLKNRAYDCLDSAVIVLDNNYQTHAGQIANSIFFEMCNSLTHVPDKLTFETLEKISKAELLFRSCIMKTLERDMNEKHI